MKSLIILFAIFMLGIGLFNRDSLATPGAVNLVFQQASSAVPATPNVRVCVMKSGMARDFKNGGIPMQSGICDTITGYYLGKKLTVPITGGNWFHLEVDQDTEYNHDGSATNWLKILSNGSWEETIR